jgi:hypothetical protein
MIPGDRAPFLFRPAWRAELPYTMRVSAMTIEERIERLTGIVESLAASVVAHDNQIEAHGRQIEGLIKVAEQQSARFDAIERQWQAYINTLPRQ